MSKGEARDKVRAVMRSVGVDPAWSRRYPHEFSNGQRQRIAIARALSVDPGLMITNEPSSTLDVSIQAQVLNLTLEAREQRGLTCLFITHDLPAVQHVGTRVAVLCPGSVCEAAETATLSPIPATPT